MRYTDIHLFLYATGTSKKHYTGLVETLVAKGSYNNYVNSHDSSCN